MTLHRIQKLSFRRVPEIRQHRVERGKFVKVSMLARRWTGAAVTGPFPIVEALLRSRWKVAFCRTLRKAMRVGRNVVHDPMNPRHLGRARIRRVRVVDDQREALRALWSSRPLQRRRDVGALAAILLGDHAVVRKRRRCQDERHSKYLHVGGSLRAVTAHVNLNRLDHPVCGAAFATFAGSAAHGAPSWLVANVGESSSFNSGSATLEGGNESSGGWHKVGVLFRVAAHVFDARLIPATTRSSRSMVLAAVKLQTVCAKVVSRLRSGKDLEWASVNARTSRA